jgi:hypothetical protein
MAILAGGNGGDAAVAPAQAILGIQAAAAALWDFSRAASRSSLFADADDAAGNETAPGNSIARRSAAIRVEASAGTACDGAI